MFYLCCGSYSGAVVHNWRNLCGWNSYVFGANAKMTVSQKPWPAARLAPPQNSQIRCPECGAVTGVVDTRPDGHGGIRRRRSCVKGHRFTTTEVIGDIRIRSVAERLRPKLAELINLFDDILLDPIERAD